MGKSITIYGSHTCEDTALVRDRLLTFQIPFTEHDKEDSPRVSEFLEKYGRGSPRTPTVVIGDEEEALVEPSEQDLDAALTAAGYSVTLPGIVQFDKSLADRPAPDFALPSTKDGQFELNRLRGWRRAVLFFAHDHTCRVCQGYTRQLVRYHPQWLEMETRTLIVLQDGLDQARRWANEFAGESEVLADVDGTVKRSFSSLGQSHMDCVKAALGDNRCSRKERHHVAAAGSDDHEAFCLPPRPPRRQCPPTCSR